MTGAECDCIAGDCAGWHCSHMCRSGRARRNAMHVEGMVEMRGLEPLTPAMRTRCSPKYELHPHGPSRSLARGPWRADRANVSAVTHGIIPLTK